MAQPRRQRPARARPRCPLRRASRRAGARGARARPRWTRPHHLDVLHHAGILVADDVAMIDELAQHQRVEERDDQFHLAGRVPDLPGQVRWRGSRGRAIRRTCGAGCWRRSTAGARPRPRRSCSRSASPTSTRPWPAARRPARPRPGRSATGRTLKLAAHHAAIAAEVARRPDVTLEELRTWLLANHGVSASLGLMHKTLARLGLTLKKSRGGRRSRTGPTSPEQRADWRAKQSGMSPARLVFVDETGAATNLARRYGRSPRGLAPGRADPAWPLEKHHVRRWPDHAWFRRPLRPRRAHERHRVPRLGRADAGAGAAAG